MRKRHVIYFIIILIAITTVWLVMCNSGNCDDGSCGDSDTTLVNCSADSNKETYYDGIEATLDIFVCPYYDDVTVLYYVGDLSDSDDSDATWTESAPCLSEAGTIDDINVKFCADGYDDKIVYDLYIEVKKADYDMSGVSFDDMTYTYDGSEKSLELSGDLPDGITVSYTQNTLTNVGVIQVTASFEGEDENYNE